MCKSTLTRCAVLVAGIFGSWLFFRYGLPILFPFLLGLGVALAAEPMVRLLDGKLKLKRWLASGVGVLAVFLLLLALLVLMTALLVRQAGRLTALVPELSQSVRVGMGSLEGMLLTVASQMPQGVRGVLTGAVTNVFSNGSAMMERLLGTLPGVLSRTLGKVTGGVLTLVTAVLAAFMISEKLPELRQLFRRRIPGKWREKYADALGGLRRTVVGWLMAQLKLTVVILGLLAAAFWLLKIPHGLLWAAVISVVDALPVLGCGVVLVPWSIICLLQSKRLLGAGLLGTYALVWLVRSVLEPRLLGKELGLDPLVTLLAIYVGYRLLGFPGLILAPLVAVVLTQVASNLLKNQEKTANNS